jgi:hypothetical protein
MPKFLLMVNHDNGVVDTGFGKSRPDEVRLHMSSNEVLIREPTASGEQIQFVALADTRLARIVRTDGEGAPAVTDGSFPESREVLAEFQVVDVEPGARAFEIAARVSAVPGPGGSPSSSRSRYGR